MAGHTLPVAAAASAETVSRILNFVVIGGYRSGTSAVQSSIDERTGAVCHADLLCFPPDVIQDGEQQRAACAAIRKTAHEAYFGAVLLEDGDQPDHFVEGLTNPIQYLNHFVFDNPRHSEQSIGLRLFYETAERWQLFDYFGDRCREGDFCVVHVVRNPVACYVSARQARQTGVYRRSVNAVKPPWPPLPVMVDQDELLAHCREHAVHCRKLKAACDDCLEVAYRDLVIEYQQTMDRVFEFLELPYSEKLAHSQWQRLRNLPLRERIANFANLRAAAPAELRELLDAEDFF